MLRALFRSLIFWNKLTELLNLTKDNLIETGCQFIIPIFTKTFLNFHWIFTLSISELIIFFSITKWPLPLKHQRQEMKSALIISISASSGYTVNVEIYANHIKDVLVQNFPPGIIFGIKGVFKLSWKWSYRFRNVYTC